ncbi:MAG: DUF294 nucleotidyltransferase-like domain-containing protein [Anaerolineae bacterium]|nr:DUF294 nucleotidyltransferase-like domain-containing protein [Anaerolineae bacterium]
MLQEVLRASASPERARVNLDRLLQVVPDPPGVLEELEADPHTLETLVAVLAGSQFLTEILLRNPGYLALLSARSGLAQIKSAGRMRAEARNATDPWLMAEDAGADAAEALDALRRYQQRELLRIGAADLGGLVELASVTGQLSRLAESVLQTALEIVAAKLNVSPEGFAVLAMGKLGGRELNYSSDIDLLFICAGGGSDGDETGASAAERCRRLGEQLIAALTEPTTEGFLYRVDMRLRPWGRVGPLTPSLAGYLRYLREHARLWEKQAFLRARPVAGDLPLGRELLAEAEPLLFAAGEESVRREAHAMKLQTESHLRQAGRTWGEVKLGEGSIRDVEFVVQYLQLAYGGRYEELRTGHTLDAMTRLAERGLLTPGEHRVLAEGYTFLRTVEHYLQILEYRQTHTLPDHPADLRYLARRLGFEGANAASEFVTRFERHSAAVRAIYLRHLAGAATPLQPSGSALLARAALDGGESLSNGDIAMMLDAYAGSSQPSPAARQHMARLAPSYAATFDPVEIERHAVMAARLDPARPVTVDAESLGDGRTRVTIVGYDYLGVLSVICGLMFASGYSIIDGYVYTYEPPALPDGGVNGPRKIVDVFTVRPVDAEDASRAGVAPGFTWDAYEAELLRLVRYLQENRGRVAQGELAKRVAAALRAREAEAVTLPPVEIELDNDASDRYTVLQISAPDTPGFLYEFTNALTRSRSPTSTSARCS